MPTDKRYTNGEVNRAGELFAELLRSLEAGKPRPTGRDDLAKLGQAILAIDWWRGLHAAPLTAVNANLRHYLKPHGQPIVSQRLKRFPTLVDKLLREPTMKLTQMADIGGCRAILIDQDAVTDVSRRLRRNWTIVRTRDYVASPKESGYRAVHHIIRRKGRMIELQLRTPLQDAWANQVEEDSRRAGTNFKGGAGQDEVHAYYVVMSEVLALREQSEEPDGDLRQRLVRRYEAAQPFLSATVRRAQ
jgi:hypothetical protein